jgi:hypothetical protein
MRRIIQIVLAWILLVLGFAAAWTPSVPVEPEDRPVEELVADPPRGDPSGARLVVWIGDSTIMSMGHRTYPEVIQRDFLAPFDVKTAVRSGPGFTFYQYYCLLGPVVASRPSLIVMVLNLLLMHEHPPINPVLCSRLPMSALLGAAALPFGDADMPFPRLVRSQFLRWPTSRAAFHTFDLLRLSAHAAWLSTWQGDPPPAPPRSGPRPTAVFLEQWRESASARDTSVRMLAAAVRLARSSGAAVLVVVSPAPMSVLRESDAWDVPAYARVIERYRTVVEDAGGELVDLHDTVPLEGFRAALGFKVVDAHLNTLGAERVAAALGPHVAVSLRIPPRAATTRTIVGNPRGELR